MFQSRLAQKKREPPLSSPRPWNCPNVEISSAHAYRVSIHLIFSFYVYLSNAVLLKFSTFRGQEEIANANSLPICLVSHTKTRCKYSKYFASMLSLIEKTTKNYAKSG